MSSVPVVRSTMSPIARSWRAYFAPVNRATGVPSVFDPARDGGFILDNPPGPWLDGGWVQNVNRTAGTKVQPLRAGMRGAATAQFRGELEARIEFDFQQWGKLQMAVAGGAEQINVLTEAAGSAGAPSGGAAAASVPVQAGSTASEIVVGTAAVGAYAAGDMIAVDVDYTGQLGYVGTGISAGYAKASAGLTSDFIRRVTFNIGRVAQTTAASLILAQPLIGRTPAANARVQKVVAFADREGGSFFQEWSGLFVFDGESGGRICFYYPRLQPCAPAGEHLWEIASPLRSITLHANLLALPFADPNDGEPVLCWRTYFPASTAAVY
ncbi:MAG TPA: hypothetical protein VFM10_09720 [Terriglobales bacterium]|nr:hypothetical protein [Terriglobales bacterium]